MSSIAKYEDIRDVKYAKWQIATLADGSLEATSMGYGGTQIKVSAKTRAELFDKIDKVASERSRKLSSDDMLPVSLVSALGGGAIAVMFERTRTPAGAAMGMIGGGLLGAGFVFVKTGMSFTMGMK